MQGSLHKPLIDHATLTFVDRCAQMQLMAWSYDGSELAWMMPSDEGLAATFQPLADAMDELVRQSILSIAHSDQPVMLPGNQPAAWVADPMGAGRGFVLAPVITDTGPDQVLGQLGPAIKALAWNLSDLRQADQNLFAVEDLAEQLGKSYENITLFYGIGRSMRSISAPINLAEGICDQIRITQGFGWSSVRYIRDDEDASGLSDACLVTGELPCDEVLFRQATSRLIASERQDPAGQRLLQVGEHELADLVDSEVVYEPILHDDRVIGLVIAGGKTGPDAEATSGDTQLLDAIAGFLGALHENAARFIEQKNMFIGSLEAVSTALDAKDRYTYGHSERVAWLGTQLAEAIGLDADEVERIRISGLVHDVGKIGVPEAVLCKAGRLTDDEFEQIKKHPQIGYNILKGIPKIDDVLDGVLYHHERWDGRGYPTRLAGEAIPLYGRILAVADTFDAMSSTRSYRQAMPREKVLAEIANCAGTQFDPALTDPFIALDFTEYDAMVRRHQGDVSEPAKERAA